MWKVFGFLYVPYVFWLFHDPWIVDKFSSVNMKVTSFLSCFIKICKHTHWSRRRKQYLFQNTIITSWQRYTLIPSLHLLPLWNMMIPEKQDSCNGRDHSSCVSLWSSSTSSHTAGRKAIDVRYWLKEAGKIPTQVLFKALSHMQVERNELSNLSVFL